MITGICHCGAVEFAVDLEPEFAVRCNCSACRKLGALWVHAPIASVRIEGQTRSYSFGDKNIAFHSCKKCRATTHWENLKPSDISKMAVNLNLAELDVIADVPVRNFDGADTWKFVD